MEDVGLRDEGNVECDLKGMLSVDFVGGRELQEGVRLRKGQVKVIGVSKRSKVCV